MNIYRFEFQRYLVPSLIWAISLSFFAFICIQLFVSFSANLNFFETILQTYSSEMLKAFGAELSTIKTLPGFYSFCFLYIMMAAAFQSTYMGIHVIGKEISGKSADFLFTKPMSRVRILSAKLGSIITCLLIANIIYATSSLMGAYATHMDFDVNLMLQIGASMFLTQVLFLSFGFLLACTLKKVKTPLTLTAGIVCFFFLLQMVVNMEPNSILSYISFLSYTSADSIIAHNGFDITKLILLLIFSVGFIASGYIIFQHRDIYTL